MLVAGVRTYVCGIDDASQGRLCVIRHSSSLLSCAGRDRAQCCHSVLIHQYRTDIRPLPQNILISYCFAMKTRFCTDLKPVVLYIDISYRTRDTFCFEISSFAIIPANVPPIEIVYSTSMIGAFCSADISENI